MASSFQTRSQRLSAHEDLRSLLGHMAAYFPFGENQMVAQDMKVRLNTIMLTRKLAYADHTNRLNTHCKR